MRKFAAPFDKPAGSCFVTTRAGNEKFVQRVKAMSTRERVAFMKDVGIFTKDGKLTSRYRD